MPGEEEKPNLLSRLSDIELPDWLKSRTIKAFDQLLGGFIEIPAAQLKGLAKKIEAKHDRDIEFDNAINVEAIEKAKEVKTFEARALAAHEIRISRFQLNRQKIAQQSLEYLNQENSRVGEEIVDIDWLEIFGSRAEKVSNEHMQQVWAKILAGELNSPGAFSLSTLMLLSNLDKSDAELIAKYRANVHAGGLVETCENSKGYFKEDLIRLNELGVLSNARMQVSYYQVIEDRESVFLTSEDEVGRGFLSAAAKTKFVKHHKGVNKISIPHMPLTREGRELLSILPTPSIEECVEAFEKLLVGYFQKIEVFEIKANNPDGSIEYSDELKREI